MSGKLFIISAPSGTGKTTLLNLVITDVKRLSFSISHTTRAPRSAEVDGKHYFFIDEETFLCMISDNQFLEWAQVHDNYYGTALQPLSDQLKRDYDVILDIDVQGAEIIRNDKRLPSVHIFIAPPDMLELERRLRGRGTDPEETIKIRLKNAHDEMLQSKQYDYFVVNDDLKRAAQVVSAIIYAERARDRRSLDGAEIV